MIKLFFGEDTFSIQKEVSEIGSEKNCEVVRVGEDVNIFVNSLLSSSFFSNSRVFLCSGLLEKLDESEKKKIMEALKRKPDDAVVVFVENKEPSGKIGRFLKEAAVIKKFLAPTEKELVTFINNKTKKEGGAISPLATERLAGFVGPDYWQLSEEIKKLVLYKKVEGRESDEEEIQTSDVEEIVKSNFEASIFELVDAISEKNQRKSIRLLNQFLESGENEIYLLTMIARQFRNIAIAKFDNISDESRLAKAAKIHPYVAKKSIRQARNFTKKEIAKIYKTIAEVDLELKSGFDPKQALQKIIF